MKKIIFVEKQDQTSYDPVTAFFGKKSSSTFKTSTLNKQPIKQKQGTKINQQHRIQNKKSQIGKSQEEITPKIGQKSQFIKPQIQKIKKDQKQQQQQKNMKKQPFKKLAEQTQFKQFDISDKNQEDSIDKLKKQTELKLNEPLSKPQKQNQMINLKKIKQLQERQAQYLRKLQEYEQKQEKYIKSEQKLNKIQKQMKLNSQKVKESQQVLQKIKQKQNIIKQLMQNDKIPFNKKRQVILSNKIKQLKRVNRQLVLRLKNYKGTDLVQLSTQLNRDQIIKDIYQIDVDKQLKEQMNIKMESSIAQLINKLNSYISNRLEIKGQKMLWPEEQKFLSEIIHISQNISLNYLQHFQICPLPESNQQAIKVYSILQNYKKSNKMQSLADRFQLNTIINEQNCQAISQLEKNNTEKLFITKQVESFSKKQKGKSNKKSNTEGLLKIIERRSNFNEILLIQTIYQLKCIKQWIQRVHTKLNEQISNVFRLVKQTKNIVELGQSAKQSLYLYLSTNIDKLVTSIPNLKVQIKQIQANYNEFQKLVENK